MHLMLSVAVVTAALLTLALCQANEMSARDDLVTLSRTKRQIQSRLVRNRPLRRGGMQINLEDVRATTVQVGFSYVQGVHTYVVSAFEWSDGRIAQTVATNEQRVNQHRRQATLEKLFPGRQYLVQIKALNSANRQVGSTSETLVMTALRCYVCNGRATNSECKGTNAVLECPAGTDSCLNELRYQNGLATITKRCAQYVPDLSRKIRGGKDVSKECQGNVVKDSFCSCMCKSDLCNEEELPCATRCFPGKLGAPESGFVDCTNLNREGSVCSWRCRPGMNVMGVSQSVCRSDGTWSILTPPRCVKPMIRDPTGPVFRCPRLRAPPNGEIDCTERNSRGSICSFQCKSGFKLAAESTTRTCSSNGRWTGSKPVCTETTCPRISSVSFRQVDCNNQYRVGSVCKISCAGKYSLNGDNEVTCLPDGTWSSRIATCRLHGCLARQRTAPNVNVECDDLEDETAVCQYSCKRGYAIQGATTSTCSSGVWRTSPPACRRLRCQPGLTQPESGLMRCSNQQFYNSNCTFSCHTDYSLIGASSSVCLSSGRWSNPSPTCQRVYCRPIGQFLSGSYSCNNGRSKGSVCRFTCNRGYGLGLGSRRSITCEALKEPRAGAQYTGKWSSDIPKCERTRCPKVDLASGMTRTCSLQDYRVVGNVCNYRCQPGYQVAGRSRITCLPSRAGRSLGIWSLRPPVCIRRRCRPLPLIYKGKSTCTETIFSGSECTVTCDHGYELIGNSEIICGNDGRWSSRVPTCKRVTCKDPSRTRNRNVEYRCGPPEAVVRRIPQYYVDFKCKLTCSTGYRLSGSDVSSCGMNGQWSVEDDTICADINECNTENGGCEQSCTNELGSYKCSCGENYRLLSDGKSCKLIVCPELVDDDNSRLICTNGRLIGTRCRIRCTVGYEPRDGAAVLTCRDDGTWSQDQAICLKVRCSEIRTPANGEMTCTDRNIFGSICKSSCNEGYELVGSDEAQCTETKLWTANPPRCRKIQCSEENIVLSNGRVSCSDSNFYQSQCQYSCNAGYQFSSPALVDRAPFGTNRLLPVSSCRSDGTWSALKPTCEKKQCTPQLSSMTSLRSQSIITCTEEDLFESTCGISCDLGYQLVGAARATCTESQSWTQELGHCKRVQCPVHKPIANGNIVCTEENLYQSLCTFTCDEGYNRIGSQQTYCQANRIWSVAPPRCQIVQCEESHTYIENGEVSCTSEYFYGSVCTTSCNSGYEFDEGTVAEKFRKNSIFGTLSNDTKGGSNDVIESLCLANGDWDTSKPTCVKHSCNPPVALLETQRPNGKLSCTDAERFLSVCQLACDEGYELINGADKAQCTELRQWSELIGRCTRVKCRDFEEFDNGLLACTNFNFFESTCNFQCNSGYDLVGESTSTCQADRTFSNMQPICEKIECPSTHTVLENGNASCTDGHRFESRCVYVCNPGYEMTGTTTTLFDEETATLTCMADRTWSGSLPTCQRKQCSKNDGALTKAKLNGMVECTESAWFGSRCTVTCHVGYRREGPASTRCTADADWSPTLGYCEKVECPVISAPDNGLVTCTDVNRFESVCSFRCDLGYERIGSDSATCQADQTYTKPVPTCREILCPFGFTELAHGQTICTNSNKFASRCSYECDAGYELTSSSVSAATCQSDYKWDTKTEPRCIKSRCSQADPTLLRALEHGSIICTDENRFQSECTLTCNVGYELTGGTGTTQCLSDKMWSTESGFCQKITCPAFEAPDNGVVFCSEANRYLSTCTFSCDSGYELVGESVSICQASRQFSNLIPICQKVQCSESYLEIENGEAECTESNLYESRCQYACHAGYEVTAGSKMTICEEDRTWSQDKAVCQKKICQHDHESIIQAGRNGELTCTEGNVFDSVCTVECDVGYNLVEGGKSQTRCNEKAEWEPTIGYCVKIECPEFEVVENGDLNCTETNLYLSLCEFGCDSGYEMEGSPSSTCQANKTWTTLAPSCFKISCPSDYLILEHGQVECTESNRYQSSCMYACEPGYEVASTDVSEATCTAFRTWSNQKPTCSKKRCPLNDESLVRAGIIGSVICTENNLFESNCAVECPSGYELVRGEKEITCLHTAEWSGEMGYCQRITCEEFELPSNSDMACTDENKFESICHFECASGYYLVGSPETICLADRVFSSPPPECRKINCSEVHLLLEFGSVDCTEDNLFESVCHYECQVGYHIFDSEFINEEFVTSECLEDGEWSRVLPICEKNTCPHDDEDFLAASESGEVICTEANRFGSQCELICPEGYDFIGQSMITCNEQGAWNDSIGYCQIKECEIFEPPQFSELTCSDGFNYQSECNLTCEDGHEFVNGPEISLNLPVLDDEEQIFTPAIITAECKQDRAWSLADHRTRQVPRCIKKKCPEESWVYSVPNCNITCTESNFYGSECFFRCHPGYELSNPCDSFDITSVVVTCKSDATWSKSEAPNCVRVKCSPSVADMQEAEEHGKITCTEDNLFQSTCSISCNKGYRLVGGSNVTTCMEGKEWDTLLGHCEKIECHAPKIPDFATLSCTNDFLFKSHCQIQCDPGYELYDPEDEYDEERGLSCRSDGDWCGEFPICEKIRCPEEHLQIENGVAECTESNAFQSVCSYECELGYHMIQGQSETAECSMDKKWSSKVPICENNRCPANDTSIEEAQINGDVTCTDENKFGSQCLLKCYDGYEMTGEPTTSCLHSQEWSNGLGLCNKISCPEIYATENTTLLCTDNFKYQSLCMYKCHPGYKLVEIEGVHDTTYDLQCGADASWTGVVRNCEKLSCPAEGYEFLENGRIRCSDRNLFESQCVFVCDPGYDLVDHLDNVYSNTPIRCTADGVWSVDEPPRCIRSECLPTVEEMNDAIEYGELTCTRSSLFGSRCRLTCEHGYEPDGDHDFTVCDSDNQWWPEVKGCKKIQCPALALPPNAVGIDCTDEHHVGSTCAVAGCIPGYRLSQSKAQLICTIDRVWDGVQATCEKIRCPKSHMILENGYAVCTDENNFESQCQYFCMPSYQSSDTEAKAECMANGEWSIPTPKCVPRKSCSSIVNNIIAPFALGVVKCSEGSQCRLLCDPGTQLVGESRSNCVDSEDGIQWFPPFGVCRKLSCPAIETPDNGKMECVESFRYRSLCRFRCDEGYKLVGSPTTRCRADLSWSGSMPKCEVVTCNAEYLEIENGKMSATNFNTVGSTVAFSCSFDGYELHGEPEITCLSNGRWSADKPSCQLGTCPPLNLPNGLVVCDRNVPNEYGSECSFVCDDLYHLEPANTTVSTCRFDGQWTSPRPDCIGRCDINFEKTFQNGHVFCTDSNYHHSQCSFQCDNDEDGLGNDFHLIGLNQLTCQENGRWNGTPPCCAQQCPSNGKADLFFVLDSSANIGFHNWTKILKFVNLFISSFKIGKDDFLVGAVRYNREVDARGEIALGSLDNLRSLQHAITYLQQGGRGSNTGRALAHVATNSLKASGNRPEAHDYVILVTDGESEDDVEAAAQNLRDQDATVYTIGIGAGKVNVPELQTIASDPSHVFVAEGGIGDLTQDFADAVTNSMCENPCLLNQRYREQGDYYLKDVRH
ncbi:sushi, von Willebrand factor type A, EGF and pentraxin domain-containing protein 1-like [Clavelina lepadiformis]|uniref:sushi, von Willebrand factor type A, EGF and pentraxin domain-containing protein 1-like n=1 Tax=Clavelina lepadiformis TaxID=159417 RepID=UPI0040434CBF